MMDQTEYSNSSDELVLSSGAKLFVRVAPFDKARNLFKTVIREIMGVIPMDLFERDAKTFIMQVLLVGSSSDAIEKAFESCMIYSTYNGKKIVPDIFSDESARSDYLECLFHVCEKNIMPFMKSLFVLSSVLAEVTQSTNSQKLQ